MLVLTRKNAESIHIGEDIRITIVQIGATRVKLAIDAPSKVHIERGELWQRRQEFVGLEPDASDVKSSS